MSRNTPVQDDRVPAPGRDGDEGERSLVDRTQGPHLGFGHHVEHVGAGEDAHQQVALKYYCKKEDEDK